MNLVRLRIRSDRSFLRANESVRGDEGKLSAPALHWMRLVPGPKGLCGDLPGSLLRSRDGRRPRLRLDPASARKMQATGR
jgi:hypothetical protein